MPPSMPPLPKPPVQTRPAKAVEPPPRDVSREGSGYSVATSNARMAMQGVNHAFAAGPVSAQSHARPGVKDDSAAASGKNPTRAGARSNSSPAAARAAALVAQKEREDDPAQQLLFSKKPREVAWQPKSLSDYREKVKPEQAKLRKLGSLGADLDNEDLLMKKARAEKIRQFGACLRQVNADRERGKSTDKPKPELTAAQLKQQRVQEFAKNVPKPKQKPRPRDPPTPSSAQEETEPEPDIEEEVTRLLSRHDEDRAAAARIRSQLALMD